GLCPDLGDDKLTPELVKPADGWPPKPVVPSAKELGRNPVHVRWSIQPNARLIRKPDGYRRVRIPVPDGGAHQAVSSITQLIRAEVVMGRYTLLPGRSRRRGSKSFTP